MGDPQKGHYRNIGGRTVWLPGPDPEMQRRGLLGAPKGPSAEQFHASLEEQHRFARIVGGKSTTDNGPIDAFKLTHAVEVKTKWKAKEDRIDMDRDERRRKEAFLRRNPKYYGSCVAI